MKPVPDAILVEHLLNNTPYDDLMGYYEYTDEEIAEASYYISHASPNYLWSLLEELQWMREEKANWQ